MCSTWAGRTPSTRRDGAAGLDERSAAPRRQLESRASQTFGIGIHTSPARPPLAVNSQEKVANLNADQLDGFHASSLQRRVAGSCIDGPRVASVHSDGSVSCTTTRQFPIHTVTVAGTITTQVVEPSLDLQLHCHSTAGFSGFRFINRSSAGTRR